jgi:hypothetical protein
VQLHTMRLLADRLDPRQKKGKGGKINREGRGSVRGVWRCMLEGCSVDHLL